MPLYTFYKIVCKDENIKDCYIGKTTNLNKRIINHKSKCNNENDVKYNCKLYQCIRENGNIDNWSFIEIDKGEYDNKDSAIRERYWIEELNANLNSEIPSRTKKEYNIEYRKNNKEKYKEYSKEYYKEYYQKNIEKEIQRNREYRANNRESILCDCGGKYQLFTKSKHLKTKKHQEYLLNEIK